MSNRNMHFVHPDRARSTTKPNRMVVIGARPGAVPSLWAGWGRVFKFVKWLEILMQDRGSALRTRLMWRLLMKLNMHPWIRRGNMAHFPWHPLLYCNPLTSLGPNWAWVYFPSSFQTGFYFREWSSYVDFSSLISQHWHLIECVEFKIDAGRCHNCLGHHTCLSVISYLYRSKSGARIFKPNSDKAPVEWRGRQFIMYVWA